MRSPSRPGSRKPIRGNVYKRQLLDDEEGLGVRFEELLLEVFDLVLVQAYACLLYTSQGRRGLFCGWQQSSGCLRSTQETAQGGLERFIEAEDLPHAEGGDDGSLPDAVELAEIGQRNDPVSYTHLDVYKRQDTATPMDSPRRMAFWDTAPMDTSSTCLMSTWTAGSAATIK